MSRLALPDSCTDPPAPTRGLSPLHRLVDRRAFTDTWTDALAPTRGPCRDRVQEKERRAHQSLGKASQEGRLLIISHFYHALQRIVGGDGTLL